jgi:hypothetical protein
LSYVESGTDISNIDVRWEVEGRIAVDLNDLAIIGMIYFDI